MFAFDSVFTVVLVSDRLKYAPQGIDMCASMRVHPESQTQNTNISSANIPHNNIVLCVFIYVYDLRLFMMRPVLFGLFLFFRSNGGYLLL